MANNIESLNELDVQNTITKQFRNTTLEKKVLSYVLRENFNARIFLKKDYFTIIYYQRIYNIIKELQSVNKSLILERLKREYPDEIEGSKTYLEKLYKTIIDDCDIDNIKLMIEELDKLSKSREVIVICRDMIEKLEHFNYEDFKNKMEEVFNKGSIASRLDSGDILEDYEEIKEIALDRVEKQKENEQGVVGIPTGIYELDNITGGWLNNDYVVVMGDSGGGKSIFLEYFGFIAWKAGYNVALFSLEMSKHQVEFRIHSMLAKILNKRFRLGTLKEDDFEKWEQKIKKYRDILDNYYEVVHLPRFTNTDEILQCCNDIQDKRKSVIDLVIVDYLNIMSSTRNKDRKGYTKEWSQQSSIAEELKDVFEKFNGNGIPILTGNQLSTDAKEADELEYQHMKYAKGISETATMIWGIKKTKQDKLEGTLQFQGVKLRELPNPPKIKLRPNFGFMLPHEDDSSMVDITDIRQIGV